MQDICRKNKEINYVTDSIGRIYLRLLPSAIGSLLTSTVASLIDVIILSHYLGPSMLAVVELCMPVYMLVNTLSMLISSGATTLYAHYLGEGDQEEALRFFSAATIHMLICGGLLMLVGLLFTESVTGLLGANDAVMATTLEYAHVLFFFMIPLMIYVQMLFFVRVDDDPNRVLAATTVCAVTNLGLDILFVGPLGWGPRGAALATCLAYTVGMAVNLTHFLSSKNKLHFRKNCLKGRGFRMWRAGMPLAASQLGMTVSTSVFNNVIIRAGNESYVTVYAVITQLSMTSMAIYDGVGQASQPIIAAASGAELPKRIRQVFRHGVLLELIGTGGLALLYILFAGSIASLFSIRDSELLSLTLTGIRIYALSVPMMGLNSIIMYYFQAQEKTGRGLTISLLSGSVLLIAALLVLTSLFGIKSVWSSWVVAQVLALVVGMILLRHDQGKGE
ncbi:MAG: MATE family efflux transporter [Lachnospiraceae bacterium]|nr:MATE family efflux transporter [Lachnospiraceae bacterium]